MYIRIDNEGDHQSRCLVFIGAQSGGVTFTIAAVQAFVKAKNSACVGCHREVLRSFIVAKREAGAVPRYL